MKEKSEKRGREALMGNTAYSESKVVRILWWIQQVPTARCFTVSLFPVKIICR